MSKPRSHPYHIEDGTTVFAVPRGDGAFTVHHARGALDLLMMVNANPRVVEGTVTFEDEKFTPYRVYDLGKEKK